jgi:hypothetical protein
MRAKEHQFGETSGTLSLEGWTHNYHLSKIDSSSNLTARERPKEGEICYFESSRLLGNLQDEFFTTKFFPQKFHSVQA